MRVCALMCGIRKIEGGCRSEGRRKMGKHPTTNIQRRTSNEGTFAAERFEKLTMLTGVTGILTDYPLISGLLTAIGNIFLRFEGEIGRTPVEEALSSSREGSRENLWLARENGMRGRA